MYISGEGSFGEGMCDLISGKGQYEITAWTQRIQTVISTTREMEREKDVSHCGERIYDFVNSNICLRYGQIKRLPTKYSGLKGQNGVVTLLLPPPPEALEKDIEITRIHPSVSLFAHLSNTFCACAQN